MAMTKCKECGAEISTKAESCPHCGAKRKKTSGCAIVLLALLLLFLFGTLVSQCSPNSTSGSLTKKTASVESPAASAPESSTDEETRELVWVEKGKDAVRAKLKDPDSAKFQNVYFHRGVNNVPLACGEVNSKNSFGGYGGFQRFISAGHAELTFLEEQMDRSEFVKAWNQMCAK